MGRSRDGYQAVTVFAENPFPGKKIDIWGGNLFWSHYAHVVGSVGVHGDENHVLMGFPLLVGAKSKDEAKDRCEKDIQPGMEGHLIYPRAFSRSRKLWSKVTSPVSFFK